MPINSNSDLVTACRTGNLTDVKKLLAGGADINARDDAMQTPIYKAIGSRNVELVKLLIKNGARIKIGDENCETPIAYAETLGFDSSDELYRVLSKQFEIEAKPLSDIFFEQGNTFLKEEKYERAIDEYDMAIMNCYDFPHAFYNRGLAKKEINNLAGACSDWREAGNMGIKEAYKLLWIYSPKKYDFEKSPEEAKTKVTNATTKILRKLGNNASFEDVVRHFITKKGEVIAEQMFRIFEFGWENSGHSPESYCDVYYRIFNSANKSSDIKNEEEEQEANRGYNLMAEKNGDMNQTTNELTFYNQFTTYEKKCILKLIWQLADVSHESWLAAQPSLNTASTLLNIGITTDIKELEISSKEACQLLKNHAEKDWIIKMIFTVATSDAQDHKEKNRLLSIYMENLGVTPQELLAIKNKANKIASKFGNQAVQNETTKDKLLSNGLIAILICAIVVLAKSCF